MQLDLYDYDANEIIRIVYHLHQNLEMYYTIGQGLINHGPTNTADILQRTSTISIPRNEYIHQNSHRPPLSDHEVAIMNRISSICDGDSGEHES